MRITFVNSVAYSPSGWLFDYGREDATLVVARNPFWQVGDVNGNGCVEDRDLGRVLLRFGQTFSGSEDLNGDGVVDQQDLLLVPENFGSGC